MNPEKLGTQENTPGDIKVPFRPDVLGAVPRHSLWQSRIEMKTGKEVAVKSPDGKYIELNEGESFAILRDFKSGRYQAVVRDSTGKIIRALEEGSLYGKDEYGEEIRQEKATVSGRDAVEKLKQHGEFGRMLANVYEKALKEFPQILGVDIKLSGPKEHAVLETTGGFARHQSTNPSGKPLVVMNMEMGIEHYKTLMKERAVSAKISAEKVGIDPKDLTPEILATFIFLHELGHGYDYLVNVPDGEEEKKKREAELNTLPVKGWNPAVLARALRPGGELDEWYKQNEAAFIRNGFLSRQALLEAQERAYHSISSEDVPDQFAARILRKNLKDFLLKI